MKERPHFSIFGVPVRVRATFAITVLLGMQGGLRSGLIWAAVVFVSILAHEMGHAFMGRIFGLKPSIELYAFGGQTGWIGGKNVSAGKSVLISLAGPAVSMMLAVVGLVAALFAPRGQELFETVGWLNGFWFVFNLLPVMPMDGGNALRSFLLMIGWKNLAEIGTRVLGVLLAVPLAVLAWQKDIGLGALFLAMFAASNVQSLIHYIRHKRDGDVFDALRARYPIWIQQRDGKSMIAAALEARRQATTDYLRAYATEVLAMGQCIDGDPRSALATLETAMPPGMLPGLPIYLHVLFEAGETERAQALAHQMMQTDDEELRRQAAAALASRQPRLGTA